MHIARRRRSVADEAFAFGMPRPTLERPGIFTVREYARLLVLRSRIQEQRWSEHYRRPVTSRL